MKKYIKSARMFELPSDSQKSFYGKAKVLDNGNGEYILYSYDTPVARVKDGVYEDLEYEHHSQTTNRHVRAFKKYFDIESACGGIKSVKSSTDEKVKSVNGYKIRYYGDVPDVAYSCADVIADEIRRRGFMYLEDVDTRIEELSGIDIDTIYDIQLDVYVSMILGRNGIYQNLDTGDFYTEEYAEEHPEVAEE